MTRFMSIVLMLVLVASATSSFTPMAHASRHAGTVVSDAAAHDHLNIGEHSHPATEVNAEARSCDQCAPDETSQTGHHDSKADCCAAVCHDLSIIGSLDQMTAGQLPAELGGQLQTLTAIVPSRHLRPPRA